MLPGGSTVGASNRRTMERIVEVESFVVRYSYRRRSVGGPLRVLHADITVISRRFGRSPVDRVTATQDEEAKLEAFYFV